MTPEPSMTTGELEELAAQLRGETATEPSREEIEACEPCGICGGPGELLYNKKWTGCVSCFREQTREKDVTRLLEWFRIHNRANNNYKSFRSGDVQVDWVTTTS